MQALPQKIKEVDDASYFCHCMKFVTRHHRKKVFEINAGVKRKVFKALFIIKPMSHILL